jgi:predicted dehydrogenase
MNTSRRKFVATAAATGAGLLVLPRHVLGHPFQAPSDLVNIATVGTGGMGRVNTRNVASHNIVAWCDVDSKLMEESLTNYERDLEREHKNRDGAKAKGQTARVERFTQVIGDIERMNTVHKPKLQRYSDYRVMLERQRDIDAVIVATPDHMHAPIALAAMDAGKHVYVQKPLCWSVYEAREMMKKAAANPKLVTQMGSQGHSSDDARIGYEMIRSGVIGDVSEVHVWTNRPLGFWPQGLPRPEAPLPDAAPPRGWGGRAIDSRLTQALGVYATPAHLNWNLFLGVAREVPYHPVYHPFNWRGWVDWGQGALGDMGAHLVDHPFWSLDLGYPTVIETVSTPFNRASYPHATTTYYEFPARGVKPAVKLTWYDGGLTPPRPEELGDEKLEGEGGILYVGSKGKMLQDTYGLNPRLLPLARNKEYTRPTPTLPRVPGSINGHELNWVDAIRGRQQASSPVEYAARLTEVMLLGIVALRANTKIHYDAETVRVTNNLQANQLLGREYRTGW